MDAELEMLTRDDSEADDLAALEAALAPFRDEDFGIPSLREAEFPR